MSTNSNWESWVEMIIGLWIITSPWILGFAGITTAMWSNVIAGTLVVIFALWNIFDNRTSRKS